MQAFLVSAGIVALAEVGDKTQLLSLVLAARFRRPWPIILGILIATLGNHFLAGALGSWLTGLLGPAKLRLILASSFVLMAVWILIPDKADAEPEAGRYGVLLTTLIAFFLAEMGDKTQIATVALAARYPALVQVVAGTTLGMLMANAPVVFLGERAAARLPLRWIRPAASLLFLALGIATLLSRAGGG